MGTPAGALVLLRVHRAIYRHRYVRSGELVIRLQAPVEHQFVHYSAGEEQALSEEIKRWPGASDEREPDVEPRYGDRVYLVQLEPEEHGDQLGYVARWEAVRDGRQRLVEAVGPAWDGELEEAITWGRERAPFVLFTSGPGLFEYYSAGADDPPGLDLPRWPSFADLERRVREAPNLLESHRSGSFVLLGGSELLGFPNPKSFPIPDEIGPDDA